MKVVILVAVVFVLFVSVSFAGSIEMRLLRNGLPVKTFCHKDYPLTADSDEVLCTGLESVSCYDSAGKLIPECYEDGIYAAEMIANPLDPPTGGDLGNVGPCSNLPVGGLKGNFYKVRCNLDVGGPADDDKARCQATVNSDPSTDSPQVFLPSAFPGQKCCGDDAEGIRTDMGNLGKADDYLCNRQDPSGGGNAQGPFFWENAIEKPFRIYTFHDGGLSYDLVSNGRYWFVCDTAKGIQTRTYSGFSVQHKVVLHEYDILPSPGTPQDNVGTIVGGGPSTGGPIVGGGGGGSGTTGTVVPIDAIVSTTPLVATAEDADGDGYRRDQDGNGKPEEKNGIDDCDDSNPRIHPGAQDIQNGINEDCDPGDGPDGTIFQVVDRRPGPSDYDNYAKRFICYNE